VILSSHILAEVEATCDRILIINKGKIVADGTPDILRKKASGNEVLRVGIEGGDKNEIFKELKELSTVSMVDFTHDQEDSNALEVESKEEMSSRKPIFDLCVDKGWYLIQLTPVETKLEDVFRDLTRN